MRESLRPFNTHTHTHIHKNMYTPLLFIYRTQHPRVSYKVPPPPQFYRYIMLCLSVTPHCGAVMLQFNTRQSRESTQGMEVRLRLLAPNMLT